MGLSCVKDRPSHLQQQADTHRRRWVSAASRTARHTYSSKQTHIAGNGSQLRHTYSSKQTHIAGDGSQLCQGPPVTPTAADSDTSQEMGLSCVKDCPSHLQQQTDTHRRRWVSAASRTARHTYSSKQTHIAGDGPQLCQGPPVTPTAADRHTSQEMGLSCVKDRPSHLQQQTDTHRRRWVSAASRTARHTYSSRQTHIAGDGPQLRQGPPVTPTAADRRTWQEMGLSCVKDRPSHLQQQTDAHRRRWVSAASRTARHTYSSKQTRIAGDGSQLRQGPPVTPTTANRHTSQEMGLSCVKDRPSHLQTQTDTQPTSNSGRHSSIYYSNKVIHKYFNTKN